MGNNEFYTPPKFIQLARDLMQVDQIDLDPESCDDAQALVQAKRYHTWSNLVNWATVSADTCLFNPAGGKIKNKSRISIQLQQLIDAWKAGRIKQAVFIGFQTSPLHYVRDSNLMHICMLRNRIKFWCSIDDYLAAEAKKAYNYRNMVAAEEYVKLCLVTEGMHCSNKWLIPSRSPKYDNFIGYLPPINGNDAYHRAVFVELTYDLGTLFTA